MSQGLNILLACYGTGPTFGYCLRVVAVHFVNGFGRIDIADHKAASFFQYPENLVPYGLFVGCMIDGTVRNHQMGCFIGQIQLFQFAGNKFYVGDTKFFGIGTGFIQHPVRDVNSIYKPISTNFFGQLGYRHQEQDFTPLQETLEVLGEQVKAGKIRHIGLSNETAWGTMKYLQLADQLGLPRAVSIQNPYNLLNRSFEVGLAEVAMREQCGLLAYSPLAFGMLSGKYENGARPANARITLFSRFARYTNPQAIAACSRYVTLAREHGLDPAQMALAFVTRQPFVTSNIIGATSLEQLESNLGSLSLELSDELLDAIEAIHREQPNPAP